MSPVSFTALVFVSCALVLPGVLIAWRIPSVGPPAARLAVGAIAGLAIVLQEARLAALIDLAWFPAVHLAATAAAAFFFCRTRGVVKENPRALPVESRTEHFALIAILSACFVSRLIPSALSGLPPGIDPRFHLIIVQKLLLTGRLLEDWLPFEPVRVNYPQGTHLLVALLAKYSAFAAGETGSGGGALPAAAPIAAFKFCFPVVAPLITAMVYLIARDLLGSPRVALWGALFFAIGPRWGSLGDFGWGGLPNMLGTLIGLLVIWIVVCREGMKAQLAGGALLATVPLAHNHAALVTVLILVSILAAHFSRTADARRIRRSVIATGLLSALFGADMIFGFAANMARDASAESLFRFWEPPITIWRAMISLGPPVSVPAALGAVWLLRGRPDRGSWIILAWATGLFCTFVFLEYVYRFGAYFLEGEFYSALTPSRFFTQLAAPGSILAAIFLHRAASRVPAAARLPAGVALIALLAANAAKILREPVQNEAQRAYETEFHETAAWIRANTEEDAFIFEVNDNIQTWTSCLAWRETNFTPLPVSEARLDPRVRFKHTALRDDPEAFATWRAANPSRPLYRIADGFTADDPALEPVHSHGGFTVYRWRPDAP